MFKLVKKNNALDPFDRWARDFFTTDLGDTGYRYPAVDIYEKDNLIHLDAEVPGLSKEDISVEVADGVLTISGETKKEEEEKTKNYFRTERRYGSFKRSFTLGEDVDAENIEAQFEGGMLHLTLPVKKQPEKEARKIRIK